MSFEYFLEKNKTLIGIGKLKTSEYVYLLLFLIEFNFNVKNKEALMYLFVLK